MIQRLKKEFQAAEFERAKIIESSSKAFKELCAFWDLRKPNLQASFEQSTKEQRDGLDADHLKAV